MKGLKLMWLVLVSWLSVGWTSSEEKRLLNTLLRDYDPRVRPVANYTDKLDVEIGLILRRLINVCPKSKVMTLNAFVKMEWKDASLKWIPSEYGGIDRVILPRDQVFMPDVVLWNKADKYENDELKMKVTVFADGRTLVVDPKQYKTDCLLDKGQHEVTCPIKIGSWAYDATKIDVTVGNAYNPSFSVPNDKWKITNVTAERKVLKYGTYHEDYPYINFDIDLKKNPNSHGHHKKDKSEEI